MIKVSVDYRPVTAAPYSGIARQALALAEGFSHLPNTEVLRLSQGPSDHPDRALALFAPKPAQALHRPDVRLAFEQRFLPQALRQHAVQVHVATANSGLPWWGLPCTGIVLLHDLFQLTLPVAHGGRLKAQVYRAFDQVNLRRSLRAARWVWTPSAYSAREAEAMFPWLQTKLRVLPNRVQGLAEVVQQAVPDLPQRFWLVVGTREPRKNMPAFLRAWQAARAQTPQVPDLVLVGQAADVPDPVREAPGLHFRHGLSDGELAWLYQHAQALWQPSLAEGFGLPPVEAMSLGTAVALASGSALDEVASPHCLRFDPHSPAAMQAALEQWARQPPSPMEAAARRVHAARFAQQAYEQRLADLWREVLADLPGSRA